MQNPKVISRTRVNPALSQRTQGSLNGRHLRPNGRATVFQRLRGQHRRGHVVCQVAPVCHLTAWGGCLGQTHCGRLGNHTWWGVVPGLHQRTLPPGKHNWHRLQAAGLRPCPSLSRACASHAPRAYHTIDCICCATRASPPTKSQTNILYTFPGGSRIHYTGITNPFNVAGLFWPGPPQEIRIFDEFVHGSFKTTRQTVGKRTAKFGGSWPGRRCHNHC